MPLTQLGLENYEISPVEPLHDIKGHFSKDNSNRQSERGGRHDI